MVGASNVTVTDITVQDCRVGIYVRGTDNVITKVEATRNMHGIEIDAGSVRTKVDPQLPAPQRQDGAEHPR